MVSATEMSDVMGDGAWLMPPTLDELDGYDGFDDDGGVAAPPPPPTPPPPPPPPLGGGAAIMPIADEGAPF